MTTRIRNIVVKKVKLIAQKEKIDISCEKEQDILIEKVCKELGHTVTEFYNENGKKLKKILSSLNN